jgi:hypothetical protein
MSALPALPYSGGGDARVSGELGQVAVTRPGVALWISVTAGALVLGLGAGTAWWFAFGSDLEHAASLRESADDVVFTGDDLHYFLLGEKSLAAAGSPTALESSESTFASSIGGEGSYDPEICRTLGENLSNEPAGFRGLHGTNGDSEEFRQRVFQFATLDDAVSAFGDARVAVRTCTDYLPGTTETGRWEARTLASSSDLSLVAVIGPVGEDPHTGWVAHREGNVVVIASVSVATGSVSDERAIALGLAVHERANYATAKKRDTSD